MTKVHRTISEDIIHARKTAIRELSDDQLDRELTEATNELAEAEEFYQIIHDHWLARHPDEAARV